MGDSVLFAPHVCTTFTVCTQLPKKGDIFSCKVIEVKTHVGRPGPPSRLLSLLRLSPEPIFGAHSMTKHAVVPTGMDLIFFAVTVCYIGFVNWHYSCHTRNIIYF
jgi:hypothetical protein